MSMQNISSLKFPIKSLGGVKVTHGEVEFLKILGRLCAESTIGQFCGACRRRPNLAVGDAALWQGEVHMASRDGQCRTGRR